MATSLAADERRLWYAFMQAHHRLIRDLNAELEAAHGISLPEYEVLLWVRQAPGRAIRMGELAERVMLSPSGLSRLVDRLVAGGLLQRCEFSGDARGVMARMTEGGLKRFREAAATHQAGIRSHFLERVPADLREGLAETLEGVADWSLAQAVRERRRVGREARRLSR
jgi:DNA-binding MarR family transcriptional regulator